MKLGCNDNHIALAQSDLIDLNGVRKLHRGYGVLLVTLPLFWCSKD